MTAETLHEIQRIKLHSRDLARERARCCFCFGCLSNKQGGSVERSGRPPLRGEGVLAFLKPAATPQPQS